MTIIIEQPQLQQNEGKRSYWTFWVHVIDGLTAMSVSGWKYYPDTKTISTPSVMKGAGKFVNTAKVSKTFFNKITELAIQYPGFVA